MKLRKDQISSKVVLEFVERTGRMPTQGELHKIIKSKLFAPLTKPIVPKEKAISNVKHIRRTLQGILDDGYDVVELVAALNDDIKQLRVSMQARQQEILESLRGTLKEVRLLEHLESASAAVIDVLPNPLPSLSTNIDQTGKTVHLHPDKSAQLPYNIVNLGPFSDKDITRKLLPEFNLPYTAIVEAAKSAKYSGIQFQMELPETARLTKLHFQGSSCFATIEILGPSSNGQWKKILSKRFDGRDQVMIAERASRVRVTLTQNTRRSTIQIIDLKLFHEIYSPRGTYVTKCIPLKGTGLLEFQFDQHVPEGTGVNWSYSTDLPVSGDYTNEEGISVPLDSPSFADASYQAGSNLGLKFSDIAEYDTEETFNSPVWQDPAGEALYNLESGNYREYLGTSVDSSQVPVVDIAAIDDQAVDRMVSVTYGKDAWVFRLGTMERTVVDDVGLKRMAVTGYPHWFTHLLVEENFELQVQDDFERIEYIILEINGNVLILRRPFNYTLTRGIWKCTLVIDDAILDEEEPTLSDTNRATVFTGIDPTVAVPATDSNGSTLSFYIQPYPVPIVSKHSLLTNPNFADIDRAAISQEDDRKHVLMPDITANVGSMDLVSTAFDIEAGLESIYQVGNIPDFFAITYMQEVEDKSEYILLRAGLQTNSTNISPIIRGISITLDSVQRKPPEIVRRLKLREPIYPLDS